jgi:hypothetical protein
LTAKQAAFTTGLYAKRSEFVDEATMYQLKKGDRIRLKADLSISESTRYLKAGVQGQITAIGQSGYTVVFEDDPRLVRTLSDREIELDVEA